MLKGILVSFMMIYGLACLALFLMQRSFLYFPQPSYPVDSAKRVSLSLQNGDYSGWLVNPGQGNLLLYYGGNAETVELNAEFFAELLPNWSVLLVPYRGYGGNPGTPTENGLYEDAIQIFDKVSVEYSKTALMGRSLGSGVATYVASQRETNGIVLVTPYDSIVNVAKEHYGLFPVSWLVKDRYDSAGRAESIDERALILIAENDRVITRARSESLANRLKPEQITKIIIERADHNDIAAYPKYLTQLSSFLVRLGE